LHYVRHRSPVLDATILFKTIGVLIGGEKRTNWHDDEARHPHRGG
jgi:lipopolysaccharide/colanic/teichoic acid biosynthesis glycosyltransferase